VKHKHNHPPRPARQSAPPQPPVSVAAALDRQLQEARDHHRAGQLAQAEALYRQILQAAPGHVDALYLLSVIAHQLGQHATAVELADQAILHHPNIAEFHASRGLALYALQQYQQAVASFDQAILHKPDFTEAYNNRGSALNELRQFPAALESLDRAIQLEPNYAEAHSNRANALYGLHQYPAAIQSCDRALQINPDLAAAWNNRGNSLYALKQHPQAQQAFDQCIRLNPGFAEAWNNLGTILFELGQDQQALDALDRAILLRPDYAQAYGNRGNVLQHLEQYPAALESLTRALQLDPDCDYVGGTRLHIKRFLCDWENLEAECRQVETRIGRNQKAATPFLTLNSFPALEKQAAEIYVRDRHPAPADAAPIPRRPQRDKIRVGYYSADFHQHAVCVQMIDLFERHDRTKFEIIGFSFGPDLQDDMTHRVAAAMDRFIDVRSLSDSEVADLSRKLEVDIAVDLMGFTEHFRLGIFARRAAPIQVNYLGYPGTVGADYMDYLIADRTLIPESSQPHYTEKIVYLPDSFQANSRHPISENHYTRSEQGLPEQGFVFCCFNNSYKISPSTFAVWMRVLERVEGSVLWLLASNPLADANLRKQAAQHGIAPQRLVFAQRLPLAEHLSRQRLAGLFLDTLPFNAGATASPALWAGLPLLTCMGETFAGRMGASLLCAIDLPELIATSEQAYENLAISLALNPARLQNIRDQLDRNRLSAPLFDTARFTRNLEAAYTAMQSRYHAGLPPDHIHISL
jgi:predicted O-linked N-acetylglucosamine transferase (SPINDLY family)